MTPDERATLHNFGVIVTDNLATIVPSIFLQASNLAINAIELKGILVNPVGGAIDETLLNLVDSELVALEILAGWAIQILLVIIDCVVVWRAWVLYFDRRWIMIVPLFLLTATTGKRVLAN
ncbi:hypothetical protein H0H92_001841 [Tricholoma furcatifolium]|nr:hypothetical protein H0H92_001841 [Tricholoma furcatifolium]